MTDKRLLMHQVSLAFFVFVLYQLLILSVQQYLGLNYGDPFNWARWDSGHYLQVAEKGYDFLPCAGQDGFAPDSNDMCGNTGWFPGYPYLIRLVNHIFHHFVFTGALLSKLFFFLNLFMVVLISGMKRFNLSSFLLVSIAAFTFGNIYYQAVFPISAVLFFALLALYFYQNNNLWVTGIFCLLASFFYPTGFLLGGVFAICLLLNKNESIKERFLKMLIPSAFGATGTLLAFLVYHLEVNDWSAFMQVQAKYGHRPESPVKNFGIMLKNIHPGALSIRNFIHLQSILVVTGYFLLTTWFFSRKLHHDRLKTWAYIYVSLYLLFPWTMGGDLSIYRAESLLLPFVFMLKDVKTPILVFVLAVLVAVSIPMSYLFFTSILI